jgi:glycosyltransferase involved in cell wall biosynthesis
MISVILPSHNGHRTLQLTLEAITQISLPESGVEFIVIDNASTDNTPAIIRAFQGRLPLQPVREPRRGKSYAVNTGIRVAQGNLLVFTDDDVIPAREWLVSFDKAARDHPGASIFAGQVRHFWQKAPPDWLVRLANEGRSFGGTPIDLQDGPVSPNFIKGANFMVRREVCENIGFSEASGINFSGQSQSQGGEDVDFVSRAIAGGYVLRYVSDATVKHIVRPEEVNIFSAMKRYFRIGRTTVFNKTSAPDPEVAMIFGYPRHFFRYALRNFLRASFRWVFGDRYESADIFIQLSFKWGQIYQTKKSLQYSRRQ